MSPVVDLPMETLSAEHLGKLKVKDQFRTVGLLFGLDPAELITWTVDRVTILKGKISYKFSMSQMGIELGPVTAVLDDGKVEVLDS